MDIRSIIDAEDAPAARRLPAPNTQKQDYGPPPKGLPSQIESRAPSYGERHDSRPRQLSPLQAPSYDDLRSQNGSAYGDTRSPYQRTPSSSLSSGQFSFPSHPYQSSPHGHQASQYLQRDDRSGSGGPGRHSLGHTTPIAHTPGSTPGSGMAYSSMQRPNSSHSISTPSSVQHPPPSFVRDSPHPSFSQTQSTPQPLFAQRHPSQPNTPLGPPSTYGRSSSNLHREPPGYTDDQRRLSGGPSGQQQNVGPSPTMVGSPQMYRSHTSSHGRTYSHERQKSPSVSPKTRVASLPGTELLRGSAEYAGNPNGHITPARRIMNAGSTEPSEVNEQATRQHSSVAINGLLNAMPTIKKDGYQLQNPPHFQETVSSTTENPSPNRQSTTPMSPTTRPPSLMPQTPSRPVSNCQSFGSIPLTQSSLEKSPVTSQIHGFAPSGELTGASSYVPKIEPRNDSLALTERQQATGKEPSQVVPNLASQPVKKKMRLDAQPEVTTPLGAERREVAGQDSSAAPPQTQVKKPRRMQTPIFAQSIRKANRAASGNPLLMSKRAAQGTGVQSVAEVSAAHPLHPEPAQPNVESEANGHAETNDSNVPTGQPEVESKGSLGHWEPSILNIIPSEELVKVISDFLFEQVVLRENIGVGPAGGLAGQGAVLEIEAKIGRLIDRSTMDRLRLPVETECVVSRSDPNMRINFESSMTEAQHRTLNGFLNKALVDSQPNKASTHPTSKQSKLRIPLTYKHTHETDTFYELSQTGLLALPQSITTNFNPRHANKTKVRITTDQKTGQEIAKIVKARIADIDVYSPRTQFDWRVSVNVEMDFQGDMMDLVEPDRKDRKKADRNKDRVSYKHQAYQIDLTQVTPADAIGKLEKEHELEIEVSSAEVRKQGLLLMNGQVSQYQELVTGFVDNVRVLARHCGPPER